LDAVAGRLKILRVRKTRIARTCVAGLAGLLLLAACADAASERATPAPRNTADAAAPTDDPSPTAIPAPVLGHDPRARSQLRTALGRLFDKNTGSVVVDLAMPGTTAHDDVRYRLQPPATDLVRHVVTGRQGMTIRYRSVGDDTWLRYDEDRDAGSGAPWTGSCWIHVADLRAFGEQAGAAVDLRPGRPPTALVAASYGVGRELNDRNDLGTILGTINLPAAMSLLNNAAADRFGIDPRSHEKAQVDFDVTGEVLHGYTIGMQGLFQAAEDADADLPFDPDTDQVPGSIEVSFSDVGSPVDIVAPPSTEVVEMTADDAMLEKRMIACGAGSA
jgi:hypothetical protein